MSVPALPSAIGRRSFVGLLCAAAAPAFVRAGVPTSGVNHPLTLAELRQRYGAPGDRYANLGGVEVRYRDEGSGPVLLLLHGSSSTLNSWDGVVARLKGRYRIIRFDQPPLGLSGHLSDEAIKTVGQPEALVARLLDELRIRSVSVFGTSSGGTMAYYFAATYPDRVDNLILSNTPADPVHNDKIPVSPALAAEMARAKQLGYRDLEYWRVYLSFLYGEPRRLTPETIAYYQGTNMRTPEANQFGLHALTIHNETTMARLKAVRAPVLILWGMRDPVLPPPAGKALYRYLANAVSRSFVAMETVGHYPPLESPVATADLVDAYLNRNR